MNLDFANWLRKDEVSTSTSSIAGFQRPIMGLVSRMWPPELTYACEDPFFKKKKRKHERLDEAKNNAEYRKIPDGVIKIHLPNVQQMTGFSCGAAATQAVCCYFGVGPDEQDQYMRKLGTDKDGGTSPDAICRFVRKYGLSAEAFHKMSFADVKAYLDKDRPVICAIQAYGSKKDYKEGSAGHYVIAIGYDKKHIYFEDPASQGRRTYLPISEFEARWHDSDKKGREYEGLGIVIWKRGKGSYLTKARKMD